MSASGDVAIITAMAGMPFERARHELVRLVNRGLDLPSFFEAADRVLATTLSLDGRCWLSLDPATMLPTSHFAREVGAVTLLDLVSNEFLEEDVNKFAVLARATPPVATLLKTTDGHPEQSIRYVNVLAPHGYADGDELRAVYRIGESAWGCAAIHRRRGAFDDRDIAFMVEVGGHLAEGIRRALVVTALGSNVGYDSPGLILLGSDNTVELVTPLATRWLGEILDVASPANGLPLVVMSVAQQARLAVAGQSQEVARARVPGRSGGWLLIDAAVTTGETGGQVSVIIQPARTPEIATLIAEAYGLSKRERDVTRLVLCGFSTREIGEELDVSPYTVQDHLKAIFEKVGVGSRRELVAQLFLQHYAPRLQTASRIGPNGWFADDSLIASG